MFRENIVASSMSRIFRQFADGGSFAAITAFTGSGDVEENMPYLVNLGKDLNLLGLGFIPVKGYFNDRNLNKIYDEPSFWVPNISLQQADILANKYNQDSYIWGENGVFGLYYTGNLVPATTGDKFSVDFDAELDDAYSEYKKRKFRLTNEQSEIERAEKKRSRSLRMDDDESFLDVSE
jgi:hypothetical protein